MADPIVIIGAGLSGLAAAHELQEAGESCVILESAPHVGGKLETSIVEEAYRLDRGFQVLLPSYPELRRFENLESELDLCYFKSGARLELESGPLLMANPIRHPANLLETAIGDYATFKDKLLVMKMQAEVREQKATSLLSSATGSTADYLRRYGFSEKIIAGFWAPFLSGIFLETELATAAGFFKYLARMFSSSPVAVPRLGIGELPKWLASKLTKAEIRLSTHVENVDGNVVRLKDGRQINARAVIKSTMGHTNPSDPGPFGRVVSYWFKAPTAPFEGPWLSLNPGARLSTTRPARIINHVAVLSNVSSDYALKGDALICVNVVGARRDIDQAHLLREAEAIYGESVKNWSLLRIDEIDRPFPLYLNRTDDDTPSQQGALARGRRAAKEILQQL